MTYDDLKEHGGRVYSGMAVGGRHVWEHAASPNRTSTCPVCAGCGSLS